MLVTSMGAANVNLIDESISPRVNIYEIYMNQEFALNLSAGEEFICYFTPLGNSTYTIETLGNKDTVIEISNQTSGPSFDDDSGVDSNAKIDFAGAKKNVAMSIRLYNSSDSGTITVRLTPKTTNMVKLKTYKDSAARKNQTLNYTKSIIEQVSLAFNYTWNIDFDETIMNLPTSYSIEQCNLDDDISCNSDCGTCIDAINKNNHHRNVYQFWYEAQEKFQASPGYYDIVLGITGVNHCIEKSHGNNPTNIGGLGLYNSDAAVVNQNYSVLDNIGILQHELSHVFGNKHTSPSDSCTPGQKCIMNSGFNGQDTGKLMNIWCLRCKSDFDHNLY